PTVNLRQLVLGPGAELIVLHLQILSGGDRLANLVQWLAYAGLVAGASLVARELGAGRRGEFFAASLAASIPMAILQASSTQTDAVAALWLVCLLVFLFRLRERHARPEERASVDASAVGPAEGSLEPDPRAAGGSEGGGGVDPS